MPWSAGNIFSRSNGTNTGSALWAQDETDGTDITTARHDTHDQDLSDGIDAIPGKVQDSGFSAAADSGTADTYAIALSPAVTAYAAYQRFSFKATNANTGAATLNVDGLGAKAIKKHHDQALASGDIEAGAIIDVQYDGTNFQMLSQLGNAAGDVLAANNGSEFTEATFKANLNLEIGTDVLAESDTSIGKHTIFIPAAAMRPTSSNGCAAITDVETTAGRPDLQVLDFDASADEHAQFGVAMPKSWNEGTITFKAFWTSTATDTDGVAWGLQGVACADDDTIDVAYGTGVVVTDDNISAAEDMLITAESGAVTIAGSPAAGEMCFFRVYRDVSDANDDMTEDARLVGIQMFITTDAGEDT